MRLLDEAVWPTCLTSRDANRLAGKLRKEGLKVTHLIASVSGTNDLIAWVWGDCVDIKTKKILEFEATWHFDEDRISHPTDQYHLDELEIIE